MKLGKQVAQRKLAATSAIRCAVHSCKADRLIQLRGTHTTLPHDAAQVERRYVGDFVSLAEPSATAAAVFSTRLHAVQRTRFPSQFRPSVRPSVSQMRVLWRNERLICQYLSSVIGIGI